MKRVLIFLVLSFCFAVPASAQEANKEALQAAKDLVAILNADQISRMSHAMTAQMWPEIERQLVSKIDAATLAELKGEFDKSVAAFAVDTMQDAPKVYAKYFTAQDLREMLAFYKTPTGAKALRLLPQVMADVMVDMRPRLQAFERDFDQRVVAILRKHGYGHQ